MSIIVDSEVPSSIGTEAMQCASCKRENPKFQCDCEHVNYCNALCQNVDYNRHRLMLHVFSAQQQLVLREYQRLVAEQSERILIFTRKIDFLRLDGSFQLEFIEPDTYHESVRRFQFHKRHMEELLEFIRNSTIVDVLSSVPLDTQQRVELLKPWLWSNHDSRGLREAHAFLNLPLEFTLLLLYPDSLRPVTDMAQLWNLYQVPQESRRILQEPEAGWITPLHDGFLFEAEKRGFVWEQLSIPVLRYTDGAGDSLYYGNSVPPAEKCGTFFYYDPASAAHLLSSNTLIATNKTNALGILGVSLDTIYRIYIHSGVFDELYNDMTDLVVLVQRLLGYSPTVLMQHTADQTREFFFHSIIEKLYTQTPASALHMKELDAFEDVLDHDLCIHAKAQGVEAVVLLRMVGGSRLVTEVMHTGSYTEAFSSVWIKE